MARPFYERVDWVVVMAACMLAVMSLLTIYSASSSGTGRQDVVLKQAGWFVLGFFLIVVVTSVDYHIISALAYPFYGAVLLSLATVLVFGEKIMGARRWIKLGSFSFQPSELAKIALILVLARYFSNKRKETFYLSDVFISAIFLALPFALIIKEPDLGMSVLLFPVYAAIVFVAGINLKPVLKILLFRPLLIILVIGLLVSVVYKKPMDGYWKMTEQSLIAFKEHGMPPEVLENLGKLLNKDYTKEEKFIRDVEQKIGKDVLAEYHPMIWEHTRSKFPLITFPFMFVWLNLEEYQRNRLIAFINPSSDPLGSGYHVIQSQIAIGSGGLWGKGFMNGTQSQLKFLPEQFTDFIFSVFSEEWGFIGSVALLTMYLLLILRGLSIATKARDKLGRLIVVGVITVWLVHMFVNVGVTTGIMPVTGLTLPFMSYGGSSIFSTSIGLGLLLNVSYRRFDF